MFVAMDATRIVSGVEEKPEHFLTNVCVSHLTRFADCPRVFRIREQIEKILSIHIINIL
jgi:hypothetical protein